MSILKDLWLGNVKPNEIKLPSNSEHYELVKRIIQHEEELFQTLSNQAKATYEKLRECRSELSSLVECEAFISGFRLGAHIMLEAIGDGSGEQMRVHANSARCAVHVKQYTET